MDITHTNLPGVMLLKPKAFGDSRGFFYESYQASRYSEIGIDKPFVQDNVSRSTKNVLRGLHHQREHSQGKLVYVIRGAVFDVAVDIRKNSPHFGKSFATILDDENHHQLYVPPGFAHGFCVLSNEVDFIYKCTDYYHPQSELSIQWNDPDLAIEWPTTQPILSEKDNKGLRLKDIPKEMLP